MNIIAISKTILALLPIVSDTVKAVEATQGSGAGAYKKALAIGVIGAVYSATNPTIPFSDLTVYVEQVITAIVEFFNATKAFTTGGGSTKPIVPTPVAA